MGWAWSCLSNLVALGLSISGFCVGCWGSFDDVMSRLNVSHHVWCMLRWVCPVVVPGSCGWWCAYVGKHLLLTRTWVMIMYCLVGRFL